LDKTKLGAIHQTAQTKLVKVFQAKLKIKKVFLKIIVHLP